MRLLVSSSASGARDGAGGILVTDGLQGRNLLRVVLPACLCLYECLSLLREESSTAPGVLIGFRCSWRRWRHFERQPPSRQETLPGTCSLYCSALEGTSLMGEAFWKIQASLLAPTFCGGGGGILSASGNLIGNVLHAQRSVPGHVSAGRGSVCDSRSSR